MSDNLVDIIVFVLADIVVVGNYYKTSKRTDEERFIMESIFRLMLLLVVMTWTSWASPAMRGESIGKFRMISFNRLPFFKK